MYIGGKVLSSMMTGKGVLCMLTDSFKTLRVKRVHLTHAV